MLRCLAHHTRWHLPIVAAVAVLIVLPGLGATGLSSSEGHRAVPGWAMLRSGDWFRIELFGQTYLRKPPGMPWAIAASSAIFGESEFAARLPSALGFIAMGVLAYVYARRWFGEPWALAAGLAQVLMPLHWAWARSAEIECLHNFAVQATVLALVDLLRPPASAGIRGSAFVLSAARGSPVVLAIGLVAAILLKGPAGVPAIIGVLAALATLASSVRVLARTRAWAAMLLAAVVSVGVLWVVARHNVDPDAVTQEVSEFLWSRERWVGILTLVPIALASALPGSLALLAAFGRSHAGADDRERAMHDTARLLGWGTILGLLVLVPLGVSNPRYAMPELAPLAPLAAYACRRGFAGGSVADSPRSVMRAVFLGHPVAIATGMAVAAAVMIPLQERSREKNSGRAPGLSLGAMIPAGVEVSAGAMIDARPELAHYARAYASSVGSSITVRWRPGPIARGELPTSAGAMLLLRTDAALDERRAYQAWIDSGRMVAVHDGSVAAYRFTLYRVGR